MDGIRNGEAMCCGHFGHCQQKIMLATTELGKAVTKMYNKFA